MVEQSHSSHDQQAKKGKGEGSHIPLMNILIDLRTFHQALTPRVPLPLNSTTSGPRLQHMSFGGTFKIQTTAKTICGHIYGQGKRYILFSAYILNSPSSPLQEAPVIFTKIRYDLSIFSKSIHLFTCINHC
jgi:hypothetical protein